MLLWLSTLQKFAVCALFHPLQNLAVVGGSPDSQVPRALPIKAAKTAKTGGAAKGDDCPGETGPYRNVRCEELQTTFRGASDLRQLFENVVERYGSNPAQGWREIEVR